MVGLSFKELGLGRANAVRPARVAGAGTVAESHDRCASSEGNSCVSMHVRSYGFTKSAVIGRVPLALL